MQEDAGDDLFRDLGTACLDLPTDRFIERVLEGLQHMACVTDSRICVDVSVEDAVEKLGLVGFSSPGSARRPPYRGLCLAIRVHRLLRQWAQWVDKYAAENEDKGFWDWLREDSHM